MANDYSTSTDAFADISEGNYSSSDYPQMSSMVTVASRLIDREFGRWDGFFYPTTDTVDRYYDGSGYAEQDIDEFVSISAIAVSEAGGVESSDYTAFSSSDYFVEPYNYTANGKPIRKVVIDTLNGSSKVFYRYRKSVKVSGIPGYSLTTPSLIEQAVKRQAIRWFMQAKQGYQDTGASASFGGMTFTMQSQFDPDIKKMLWPFVLELS